MRSKYQSLRRNKIHKRKEKCKEKTGRRAESASISYSYMNVFLVPFFHFSSPLLPFHSPLAICAAAQHHHRFHVSSSSGAK